MAKKMQLKASLYELTVIFDDKTSYGCDSLKSIEEATQELLSVKKLSVKKSWGKNRINKVEIKTYYPK